MIEHTKDTAIETIIATGRALHDAMMTRDRGPSVRLWKIENVRAWMDLRGMVGLNAAIECITTHDGFCQSAMFGKHREVA